MIKNFDLHLVDVTCRNEKGVVFNPYNPQRKEFKKGKTVELWYGFKENYYAKGKILKGYDNTGKIEVKVEYEDIRKAMIDKLKGNSLMVDAEWLKENDPEMLDWIISSNYWGRGVDKELTENDVILEIFFTENGTQYYVTYKGHKDEDCPSRNQPVWGEDNWEDWGETEQINNYYEKLKGVK